MKKEIQSILNDVYRAAPELKVRESEIIAVIESMLVNRPQAKLDEKFRGELRATLLSRFGIEKRPWSWPVWSRYLASAAVGGAAVMAALAMTLTLPAQPKPTVRQNEIARSGAESDGSEPQKLADRAFGSLTGNGDAPADNGASAVAVPMPESAPMAVTSDSAKIGGGATLSRMGMISPMPPLEIVRNEYRFDGEITLPAESVEVAKAVSEFDRGQLNAALGGTRIGPVSLGAFQNPNVENLTINDDSEWGYSLNVNAAEGAVYFYRNWRRWPSIGGCPADAPCEPKALTEADVPPAADLIAAARKFLADFGISTESYGEPSVNEEWRVSLAAALREGLTPWIPDEQQVIFPMLIGGLPVVDDAGNPQGLSVSVDVRSGRVSYAGPIYAQRFQTSSYPAVKDDSGLRSALERGGLYSWQDPNADSVQARKVDAPIQVMLISYVWTGQESQRLFVPALMFRVANREAEMTSSQWLPPAIVLPLAAEFYENLPTDVPRPMPLESAAAPAAKPALEISR